MAEVPLGADASVANTDLWHAYVKILVEVS